MSDDHGSAPLSPQQAGALHRNLGRPLHSLRFTPPLEEDFLTHLRTTQKRTTLFTLWIATLIWMTYAGLDLWRVQAIANPADQAAFLWRSFAPRWPTLLCFGCTIYALRHIDRVSRVQYEWGVASCLVACSIAIPLSSYTLKNLGMAESSPVMVLLISLAFFPLGVRLRVMGPVALFVSLAITLSGPLVLHERHDWRAHWVLSAVVWITFVLTGVAAYFREKGLREQFILRQLLDWEASHDALTGLANRRMYREHFSTCLKQAQRQHDPLYLVVLDIDHFKLYNDHYGHSTGDQALRQLSALLQRFAQRPMDLAMRLGGEEFGLVIYGMRPEHVSTHLEQLQSQLKALHIAHATSLTTSHMTVSMGAAMALSADTTDSIFQRADALLYQAKRQGRNQACVQVVSSAANAHPGQLTLVG